MAIGFILMHVSPKHEQEVLTNLLKLFEILEVHPLFGEYDFIAKVQSVWYEHIEEIANKIRTIEYITNTQLLAAINY